MAGKRSRIPKYGTAEKITYGGGLLRKVAGDAVRPCTHNDADRL